MGELFYCTLFDRNYLTRGLAMIQSLLEQDSRSRIFVLPFDSDSHTVLKSLNEPRLTLINIVDFEDSELLKVKKTRSPVEYFWTCTPSLVQYCLQKYQIAHCTYIDADLFFYSSPRDLVEEIGEQNILLTEHRFTPQYDQTETSGKYCVQFMFFRNSQPALDALKWWREKCLEWCSTTPEEGRFGDQKYLDDWAERFSGVHVLQNLGGGLAPWNIQQYQVTHSEPLSLKEKRTEKSFPAVFYHFHGLRIYQNNQCEVSAYSIESSIFECIYKPYIRRLTRIEKDLVEKMGLTYSGIRQKRSLNLRSFYRMVKGRLSGHLLMMNIKDLCQN